MNTWLSIGTLVSLVAVAFVLLRWGRMSLTGSRPVSVPVFVAILFASGLDVGLIMFPLTEFPIYDDTHTSPEYGFTNPLAIAFGFWGFLVWSVYFLTCFYFCAFEPRIGFFKIPLVKFINNVLIIGTCAFTAYLLFANLSWYLPELAVTGRSSLMYGGIVLLTILAAVYSSTKMRFVTLLSVFSGVAFLLMIVVLVVSTLYKGLSSPDDYVATIPLVLDYFSHIPTFVLPINDYHAFYQYWWFAWSIMIGQFTAKFVGRMQTWQLFVHMLVWPSITIAVWFAVLYVFYENQIQTAGWINLLMVSVGVIFVINSLDSLIRVYSENLGLCAKRLGTKRYCAIHAGLLCTLTVFFSLNFLQIQWVGAVVIAIGIVCMSYAFVTRAEWKRVPAA